MRRRHGRHRLRLGREPDRHRHLRVERERDDFAKQRDADARDFKKASGVEVKINAVDHNTFQENINTYLQGDADDVFSWFAGYRMRFFAKPA